jgi:glycosyltransferase involved in cell wall biosynthesis
MKISIAMATYNGAQYLYAQLQSFLAQTRQPDELIITDDCSTDETGTIIENFAQKAPFEVIFSRNKQNLGYAQNFSKALSLCSGDLIFLSDQDDVWFSEKLAYLEEMAEMHPDKLVIMNDATLTDADLNEVGLTKLGQIYSAGISGQSFVMGCCCAVRRELLDLCLPIPAGYKSHDNWLVYFAEGLSSKLISERVLQYYRRHGNNESQCIVNRTTRVTRWDRYKESLSCAWQPTSGSVELAGLQQIRLQIEGVERALKYDTGKYKYRCHLQMMASEGRTDLKIMEKRIEIRSKWFLSRLIASLAYWLAGGYKRGCGFRNVVRDVIG